MSSLSDTAVNHDQVPVVENGFDKQMIDTNLYYGELEKKSGFNGTAISERVQHIALRIYQEFEAIIQSYGLPVVQSLMPLIIEILDDLNDLHNDQSAYRAEMSQLREKFDHIYEQLKNEKSGRKLSEMRLLQAEDALDEERKAGDIKTEQMSSSYRQLELKYQLLADQVSRFELKEKDATKEINRLYERINELVRSNVDLTQQLGIQNRLYKTENSYMNNKSNIKISEDGSSTNEDQVMSTPHTSFNQPIRPTAGQTLASELQSYDANSNGFGFDEMPSTADPENHREFENNLPAGMRREIDVLIKENMDLLETKNALNVVKDDLLSKIDRLTSENVAYKDSLSQISTIKSNLQTELATTDQLLNDARSELIELRYKIESNQDLKNDPDIGAQRKRFTRSEMARVLAEKNHYKERLSELQDAVRLTEALRVGESAVVDLLPHCPFTHRACLISAKDTTTTPPTSTTPGAITVSTTTADASNIIVNNGAVTTSCGPLQSLQKFFSAFASGSRMDQVYNPGRHVDNFKYADINQSWITLSRNKTHAPVYGWSSHARNIDSAKLPSKSCNTVPIPVQCRTIGGLRGSHLEVNTALIVPSNSGSQNLKEASNFHLWLIGRSAGGADASPTPSRSFIGQVHIFTTNRFTQPICSFHLENGFLPTSAAYVKSMNADTCTDSELQTSINMEDEPTDEIILQWEQTTTNGGKLDSGFNANQGYVMLASSDGRFLVYNLSSDQLANSSPRLFCRFHIRTPNLIANNMIAVNGHVCLGLSNPNGVHQLLIFNWSTLEQSLCNSTNQFKAKLLHIPYCDEAETDAESLTSTNTTYNQVIMPAGPLVICLNTNQTEKEIWLGTAGGGYCHSLNLRTRRFISSLKLPSENPCLHAIELQVNDTDMSQLIWLALSGNPFVQNASTGPYTSELSTATIGNYTTCGTDSNNNNNTENVHSLGGMARILVFCAKRLQILRQFDMTHSLTTMLDMEGVTDPIDLTICRLLILSAKNVNKQEIWLATRSGLIARLNLDEFMKSVDGLGGESCVSLPPSSITLSCHGYRRPVCNFLQVPGKSHYSQWVVSIGHDYVDLRSVHSQLMNQPAEDSTHLDTSYEDQGLLYMRRCYQKGSGAHAIVWLLDIV